MPTAHATSGSSITRSATVAPTPSCATASRARATAAAPWGNPGPSAPRPSRPHRRGQRRTHVRGTELTWRRDQARPLDTGSLPPVRRHRSVCRGDGRRRVWLRPRLLVQEAGPQHLPLGVPLRPPRVRAGTQLTPSSIARPGRPGTRTRGSAGGTSDAGAAAPAPTTHSGHRRRHGAPRRRSRRGRRLVQSRHRQHLPPPAGDAATRQMRDTRPASVTARSTHAVEGPHRRLAPLACGAWCHALGTLWRSTRLATTTPRFDTTKSTT
jgi:hypothetical protein